MTVTNATGITTAHFKRSTSSLNDHQSVFFHVSADLPSTWTNDIFHNSRYGIFHLHSENGKLKLELTSKGLDTIKFRKATVKNEEHAINKVLQWLSTIKGESLFLT